VHDAHVVAARGKAAVVVCTEQFTNLAKVLNTNAGMPHFPVLTLPYPLDTRPEADVRAIARQALPELFACLGVKQ
jgi:hypothetical protein